MPFVPCPSYRAYPAKCDRISIGTQKLRVWHRFQGQVGSPECCFKHPIRTQVVNQVTKQIHDALYMWQGSYFLAVLAEMGRTRLVLPRILHMEVTYLSRERRGGLKRFKRSIQFINIPNELLGKGISQTHVPPFFINLLVFNYSFILLFIDSFVLSFVRSFVRLFVRSVHSCITLKSVG